MKGHTVIMIGDRVNDSPALSEADAAIAREIADITIGSEDLFALVTLRRLSETLMARIHQNYRTIVGFNLMLIILGGGGTDPADDFGAAAQCFDAGHQPAQHDESAAGGRKEQLNKGK